MGCPHVRGDNPRALACGLSYVQVDKHGITIYATYTSVDLAHQELFHAKVGKGGIMLYTGVTKNKALLFMAKLPSGDRIVQIIEKRQHWLRPSS